MSLAPSSISTTVVDSSTNGDTQDGFVEAMAERVRTLAKHLNYNASSFGQAAGLKSSASANYWNGKRPYPTEALPRMAEVLRTNVDFLVIGYRPAFAAIDADEADWEWVPRFDLRDIKDDGKGERIDATPMRRDWLARTLGTASELWLAAMLSDYPAHEIYEGDLVFCREIEPAELLDGQLVIWRINQGLTVARYSVRGVPGDNIVTSLEVSPEHFVPVARILGKFMQRF